MGGRRSVRVAARRPPRGPARYGTGERAHGWRTVPRGRPLARRRRPPLHKDLEAHFQLGVQAALAVAPRHARHLAPGHELLVVLHLGDDVEELLRRVAAGAEGGGGGGGGRSQLMRGSGWGGVAV
jgi:hypothetical protein